MIVFCTPQYISVPKRVKGTCKVSSLLKSLGEVLGLGFPDGSNRYDGNKPDPHPQVVCVQCKKVIVDLVTLKDMTAEVLDETR